MTGIMNIAWAWIAANPETAAAGALAVAEVITRLTPTKKDDGFIVRLGKGIGKLFDIAKFPNKLKR